MEKRTVDAHGELCPKPLILTKKALKGFDGELTILLDNDTAFRNVKRFLADNDREFSTAADDEGFIIRVNSGGEQSEMSDAEEYCTIPASVNTDKNRKASYIIVFKSDVMGGGDEELGRLLIQGFCNTIREMDPLPSSLIFYNSGVRLAAGGSPVLPALEELAAGGMNILVCGTCVDYYDIKDRIKTGIISNMYDILGCMSGAGHIIYP